MTSGQGSEFITCWYLQIYEVDTQVIILNCTVEMLNINECILTTLNEYLLTLEQVNTYNLHWFWVKLKVKNAVSSRQ